MPEIALRCEAAGAHEVIDFPAFARRQAGGRQLPVSDLRQLTLRILHQVKTDAAAARHFAHQQVLQLGAVILQRNFHRAQQTLVEAGGKQRLAAAQPALPLFRLLMRPNFIEIDKVLRGQRGQALDGQFHTEFPRS
ncbi:hypothetical protein AK51_00035 [Serratia nematodiphila DZ0503SBS1]|nr:hypothetical protein AK51_00035 [Serratia nematodiphila DZ0503SBS1]